MLTLAQLHILSVQNVDYFVCYFVLITLWFLSLVISDGHLVLFSVLNKIWNVITTFVLVVSFRHIDLVYLTFSRF